MSSTNSAFKQFGLPQALIAALSELGYEAPTPIQEQAIPVLMEGKDILAQAQTGTGKTAAFALPILANLNTAINKTQALVIAPTRELAIQVAEAFQSYAKHLRNLNVIPIYGGQDYPTQLRALKRGAHIVVGTPGRIMDHLRRGTLVLDELDTLVLDEADEMLRMGFVDDIEWILEHVPAAHRTALFSATLPENIKKIAKNYLKDPVKIHIKPKESSVAGIEQLVIRVAQGQKLEALSRYLEVEDVNAAIIFTRTKTHAAEVAEQLQSRGYSAAALHGDMAQAMRKQVVDRVKKGSLNIVVATDVAARGLDIDRISHVINYDIPGETESYIHRIGRTGRAGRKGKALLFVGPKDQRLLRDIERVFGVPLKEIKAPSVQDMQEKRSSQLAGKIAAVIEKNQDLSNYYHMLENIMSTNECSLKDVAAALLCLQQKSKPISNIEIHAGKAYEDAPRGKPKFGGKPRSGGYGHGKNKRFSNDRREKSFGDEKDSRTLSRNKSGKSFSKHKGDRPFSKKKSSHSNSQRARYK